MTDSKRSGLRRPPRAAQSDVDEFVSGAERNERSQREGGASSATAGAETTYPWHASHLRDDVTKPYNLRLPEPYHAKLRWLSKQGPESMHEIALDAVMREIDERIHSLAGEPPKSSGSQGNMR